MSEPKFRSLHEPTPSLPYGFSKRYQYCINMVIKTLRGRSEGVGSWRDLNFGSDTVQSFSYPTSHWVNRLDNVDRVYSAATEIVQFGEFFIFVPTCDVEWARIDLKTADDCRKITDFDSNLVHDRYLGFTNA